MHPTLLTRWLRRAGAGLATAFLLGSSALAREPWTPDQARAWEARTPWLVGCNFAPSTAINQLEMWQAETFDPVTIDRELGWAAGLGFNSVRVFLHDLPWRADRRGFLERLDRFLAIADRHGIGTMFVLFDACWDPRPKAGPQPAPRPHVHNSGWVQCPGAEILGAPERHDALRDYVVGIVRHFRTDRRVQVWDLFNEPDNDNRNSYGAHGARTELANKADLALPLLRKTFEWARAADPVQPLTAGVWVGPWPDPAQLPTIDRLMLEGSDVISFHSYGPLDQVQERVAQLRRYGRPILCTEYMARPAGSTFETHLAWFKDQKIGAYNWGFVAGKTQTIYPWDSWQKPYTAEPPVWFHDLLRTNGVPYDPREIETIRRVTRPAPRK